MKAIGQLAENKLIPAVQTITQLVARSTTHSRSAIFDRLRQRLPFSRGRPTPTPSHAPTVSPGSSVADRARSLAERWLEDESLRGDLDDHTWQPIQDWLLAVASRVATATAGQDNTTAQPLLDQAQAVGTALARTLATALGPGVSPADLGRHLEPLQHELRSPIVEPDRAPRVNAALRAAVAELSHSPSDGPTMAARLTAALDAGITSTGKRP
jgi:hypothetical protein